MTFWKAVVLGAIQGITEFLPISSSGHLVLAQYLFGFKESLLAFDVVLHLATLIAVFIYFRKDILSMTAESLAGIGELIRGKSPAAILTERPHAASAWFVILSTVPTVLIGFAFKDYFESLFGSMSALAFFWIVTGILLFVSRWFQNGRGTIQDMKPWHAVMIGIAQAAAIIPSVSRSGTTILAALILGMEKKEAARFSFLLSIPAILGAGVLEARHGLEMAQADFLPVAAGFLVSGIIGYLSIAFLLKMIQKGSFFVFGIYCIAAGIFTYVLILPR